MTTTQATKCPCHDCKRDCEFWTQKIGNETDTVIEPVNLERDQRIEARKHLDALKARDEKAIKRKLSK